MAKELFFVALLLPTEISQSVIKLQKYCAENFHSEKALNSPPHITLQPPFTFPIDEKQKLLDYLRNFAKNNISISIILDGFNCFEPRVIYIDVQHTTELLQVQKKLKVGFEEQFQIQDDRYQNRSFCPHVTIAFKDLTRTNFDRAWAEFKTQSIHHEFTVNKLSLLKYDGRSWQLDQTFALH